MTRMMREMKSMTIKLILMMMTTMWMTTMMMIDVADGDDIPYYNHGCYHGCNFFLSHKRLYSVFKVANKLRICGN